MVIVEPCGRVCVGGLIMKEDDSLREMCKVFYYNCSSLECGLL